MKNSWQDFFTSTSVIIFLLNTLLGVTSSRAVNKNEIDCVCNAFHPGAIGKSVTTSRCSDGIENLISNHNIFINDQFCDPDLLSGVSFSCQSPSDYGFDITKPCPDEANKKTCPFETYESQGHGCSWTQKSLCASVGTQCITVASVGFRNTHEISLFQDNCSNKQDCNKADIEFCQPELPYGIEDDYYESCFSVKTEQECNSQSASYIRKASCHWGPVGDGSLFTDCCDAPLSGPFSFYNIQIPDPSTAGENWCGDDSVGKEYNLTRSDEKPPGHASLCKDIVGIYVLNSYSREEYEVAASLEHLNPGFSKIIEAYDNFCCSLASPSPSSVITMFPSNFPPTLSFSPTSISSVSMPSILPSGSPTHSFTKAPTSSSLLMPSDEPSDSPLYSPPSIVVIQGPTYFPHSPGNSANPSSSPSITPTGSSTSSQPSKRPFAPSVEPSPTFTPTHRATDIVEPSNHHDLIILTPISSILFNPVDCLFDCQHTNSSIKKTSKSAKTSSEKNNQKHGNL